MNPIKTQESNFIYLGPTTEISDLHCRRQGRDTFSVWTLTPDERRMISEGANIRLGIHGVVPIPPVSLGIVADAGWQVRIPAPCRICGREPDDNVHASGPETHAYKC